MPSLKTLSFALSNSDNIDIVARDVDLAFAFNHLITAVHAPSLELIELDLINLGYQALEKRTVKRIDWDRVRGALYAMRATQASLLRIKIVFHSTQRNFVVIRAIRNELRRLEEQGMVSYTFELGETDDDERILDSSSWWAGL